MFWPGNRLHEFGRIVADMDLSFIWSQRAWERGDLLEADTNLWACGAERARARCEGLRDALQALGHGASGIIEPFLASADFARLSNTLNEAEAAKARDNVSPAAAKRAVEMAHEMARLAAAAFDRAGAGS